MPPKRWLFPEGPQASSGLGFPAPESVILHNRGLVRSQEIEAFLTKHYEGDDDPFQMRDMEIAVERLMQARQSGDQVVIYGDYDADGATATALLVGLLGSMEWNVSWYVPDRFSEGYGLNDRALKEIRESGASVVVSVDCGIRSVDTIENANSLGLDMIVTDHHLPGPELPPALAVIDPNREDDTYPFKGLAGVGIAYKLGQALAMRSSDGDLPRQLDLVAVGTVADLSPLIGENRSLVGAGLEQLNRAARPGLRALSEFSGHKPGSISSNSVGFGLGPRLNAAGRLADANLAVDLLLASDGPQAWEKAGNLDRLNRKRQQLTDEIYQRAREVAEESSPSNLLLFAAGEDFHEGVLGLVAGRLMDEAYRPALVAQNKAGTLRGSARSIAEFHITDALEKCSDLLLRFGGHARAAGFSLTEANERQFADRMSELAAEALSGIDLRPALQIDAEVGFGELDEELMVFIDRLQPCGEANPYPVFASSDVQVHQKRAVGQGGRHLKLTLEQAGKVFDSIAFGFGSELAGLPDRIDVAYQLERNEFRGVETLQLNVQDLRPVQNRHLAK